MAKNRASYRSLQKRVKASQDTVEENKKVLIKWLKEKKAKNDPKVEALRAKIEYREKLHKPTGELEIQLRKLNDIDNRIIYELNELGCYDFGSICSGCGGGHSIGGCPIEYNCNDQGAPSFFSVRL